MNGTKTTLSIAPPALLSPADKAAHAAASYVRRPVAASTDSDPDMDEALRRATAAVERAEAEREQARRGEIEAAWAEYADQPLAEYYEYLESAA